MRRPRIRRYLAIGVPLAALVLAGCAGKASGPGVATAGGADARGVASATPTASADMQTRMLHYAECMRQHGMNMPDPDTAAGGIQLTLPSGSRSDPRVQAAMQACEQYLPNGGAPPSLSPQAIDQLRKYAECMREHGTQMSDPDPNTGGIRVGGGSGDKTQVLNDPNFKQAQQACQSSAPKGNGK